MNKWLLLSYIWIVSCSGIRARYHVVSSGETLQEIAKQYDVPVRALAASNKNPSSLRRGMKLYIPFEKNPEWDAEFEIPRKEQTTYYRSSSSQSINFNWPLLGYVSSPFGNRRGHFHEGIDIPSRQGTQVKASRSGHVIYAGNQIPGYGNLVIIRHADQYSTVYAHLSKIGVRKGQFATRGQTIGRVGQTGHATAPHLHFEIRNQQKAVDPLFFLQRKYAHNTLGK